MKRTQPPETEVVKTAEICKKRKFVKSHQVILFLAGFSPLEPLCAMWVVFVVDTHDFLLSWVQSTYVPYLLSRFTLPNANLEMLLT